MSTISLSSPDAMRARRVPVSGMILLLSGLVTLAIFLLMMATAGVAVHGTGQAAVSQSPAAVPVPAPSNAGMQPVPTETPAPHTYETSGPTVIAVPVPTAPSFP